MIKLMLAMTGLTCILWVSIGAYAQSVTVIAPETISSGTVTAPVVKYSLSDCIALATANQPDYQAVLLNYQASEARLSQSQASYLPTISVQNNDIHLEDPKKNTGYGTSLVATQTFYDSGLRDMRNEQASLTVDIDEAGMTRTKQALNYNVLYYYISLLRAQKILIVYRRQLDCMQNQYDALEKKVNSGKAVKEDLLQIALQISNSQISILNAENSIRKSVVALQNIIGLSFSSQFEIMELDEPESLEMKTIDDYLSMARTERPEVQQAKMREAVAELNLRSIKLNGVPRLQLTGQYRMEVDSKMAHNWNLMGVINYNIFDGNLQKAKEIEAGSTLDATRQRSLSTINTVQADVLNSYLSLKNAKERRAKTDGSIIVAKMNYDYLLARAQTGKGTYLDATNAGVQLSSAETNAINAKYDYILALAQLQYAIGQDGIQ